MEKKSKKIGEYSEAIKFIILLMLCISAIIIRFITSHNFKANIDSYFYARFEFIGQPFDFLSYCISYLGITITACIIIIFFIGSIIFILFILKCDMIHALFCLGIFLFMPLSFINTRFTFDKNIIVMFLLIWFCYSLIERKHIISIIIILFTMFIWKGFPMMVFILLYCLLWDYFIENIPDKINLLIIFICCVIFLLMIKTFIVGFLILTSFMQGIALNKFILETQSFLQYGFFPEILLIMVIIYDFIRSYSYVQKSQLKFLLLTIILFCCSLYAFRLWIFVIPFLIYSCSKITYAKSFLYVVILISALFYIPAYNYVPYDDNNIQNAMSYINRQNTSCIINDWGQGHIYQYYTNKNVYYKGHPSNYKDAINILWNGKNTECSIIWKDRDIITMSGFSNYTDIQLNDIPYVMQVENKKFYGDIDYYVVVK